MSTTVTVYTKPHCVQCTMTKKALDAAGTPYATVDLTEDPTAMDTVLALGHRAAPVVIVTDATGTTNDHWSGFQPDKIAALAS